MFLSPRFFREDDATGGAGGGEPLSKEPPAQVDAPLITLDEIKGYGFENSDQLKTFLAQQKAQNIDPQEKIKQANLEKANLLTFAAQNELLSVDEYNSLENLKSKSNIDLVREDFTASYKEDNPEADLDEITAAFDSQYPLNSENPAVKKWAEKQLSKNANDLRSPLESKYKDAEDNYKTYASYKEKVPGFNKFVDDIINASIPEKLTFHKTKEGEQEIPIESELTAEQRTELKKEIGQLFRGKNTFEKYAAEGSNVEELKAQISKKINGYIKINNFEKAIEKGFEAGKGIGVTKGSNVGAEQPFAIVRNMNIPSAEQRVSGKQEVLNDELEFRRKMNQR